MFINSNVHLKLITLRNIAAILQCALKSILNLSTLSLVKTCSAGFNV